MTGTTKPQTPGATKPEPPPIVFTAEHPEYPFLLYNHKTRQTKAAADEKQKGELAGEGFVEEPFPPEDPEALTDAETTQLQALLAKGAKALTKLGKLSQQQDSDKAPENKAAGSKPNHQQHEPEKAPPKH